MQLSSKQAWINYNKRIIQVSRTQFISQKAEKEETVISTLLKKLSSLSSNQHPNVLLTKVLKPSDPRGELYDFDLAKPKEITGLLDNIPGRSERIPKTICQHTRLAVCSHNQEQRYKRRNIQGSVRSSRPP